MDLKKNGRDLPKKELPDFLKPPICPDEDQDGQEE